MSGERPTRFAQPGSPSPQRRLARGPPTPMQRRPPPPPRARARRPSGRSSARTRARARGAQRAPRASPRGAARPPEAWVSPLALKLRPRTPRGDLLASHSHPAGVRAGPPPAARAWSGTHRGRPALLGSASTQKRAAEFVPPARRFHSARARRRSARPAASGARGRSRTSGAPGELPRKAACVTPIPLRPPALPPSPARAMPRKSARAQKATAASVVTDEMRAMAALARLDALNRDDGCVCADRDARPPARVTARPPRARTAAGRLGTFGASKRADTPAMLRGLCSQRGARANSVVCACALAPPPVPVRARIQWRCRRRGRGGRLRR